MNELLHCMLIFDNKQTMHLENEWHKNVNIANKKSRLLRD